MCRTHSLIIHRTVVRIIRVLLRMFRVPLGIMVRESHKTRVYRLRDSNSKCPHKIHSKLTLLEAKADRNMILTTFQMSLHLLTIAMPIKPSIRKTLLRLTLKTSGRVEVAPLLAAKKLVSHRTESSFMDKIKTRSRKTSTRLSSKTTRGLNSLINSFMAGQLVGADKQSKSSLNSRDRSSNQMHRGILCSKLAGRLFPKTRETLRMWLLQYRHSSREFLTVLKEQVQHRLRRM
jgi:hypothetical protein